MRSLEIFTKHNTSKLISKNVLTLPIVSLFTDVASEMLYPLVYLASFQANSVFPFKTPND
jgi:hypothetical protein